jgi:hypothetical protein
VDKRYKVIREFKTDTASVRAGESALIDCPKTLLQHMSD